MARRDERRIEAIAALASCLHLLLPARSEGPRRRKHTATILVFYSVSKSLNQCACCFRSPISQNLTAQRPDLSRTSALPHGESSALIALHFQIPSATRPPRGPSVIVRYCKNVIGITIGAILSRLARTIAESASQRFEFNGARSMGGFIVTARNTLLRAAIFFAFWLILSGTKPADLVVGALAAIAATWVSLRLLPAGEWSLGVVALARLVLRFPLQSIAAGIDVARRAFHRRLPLRPGFVVYRSRLPAGEHAMRSPH